MTDPSGKRTTETLDHLPLLLTVEEAASVLRIGRNGAYAAVSEGVLPSFRIGRRIRIPRSALVALVHQPTAVTGDNVATAQH
jgi:excisionase family DNA binding protein